MTQQIFPGRLATSFGLSLVVSTIACAGGDPGNTMGLIHKGENCSPGYNLFSPSNGPQTFLIDNDGNLVNEWLDDLPVGNTIYLLENGNLIRCSDNGPQEGSVMAAGGDGGCIRTFDWDNNLLWDFCYNTPEHRPHHDIEPLPNGNVLMIIWEYMSAEDAIAAGRDPANIDTADENSVWPLQIIEVQPDGADGVIVWEWHLKDHLIQDFDSTKSNYGVVADNPGKMDFNYVRDNRGDWIHANSIDYNPELDQILVSSPFISEVWIINHGITSQEAAGPLGDIMYRWGNPIVYDRGTAEDQRLFFNHDARWVTAGYPGEGNITVFNNGQGRTPDPYSTIDEWTPPVNPDGTYPLDPGGIYGPEATTVLYQSDPVTVFYSSGLSGVERQPNGNTLFCKGRGSGDDPVGGQFYEITPTGELTWLYVNPVTSSGPLTQGDTPSGQLVFRNSRYPTDFPGFDGKDLTPQGPLELPNPCAFDLNNDNNIDGADLGLMLALWNNPYDGADMGLLLSAWGPCPDRKP